MARVKLHPRRSKILSTGVWTVEVKVHSEGIPPGGGIRLLWVNGGDFTDRNAFSADTSGYDVRVLGVPEDDYSLRIRWLLQRSLGPEVTVTTSRPIDGGTVLKCLFGEKGKWKTGHYPVTIDLYVYEDLRGNGLFRKIPEIHTLEAQPLGLAMIDAYTSAQIDGGGRAKVEVRFRDAIRNRLLPPRQDVKLHANGTPLELPPTTSCFVTEPVFSQDGFSKITVMAQKGKARLQCTANPILNRKWDDLSLYFGDIHCHTDYSDGQRTVKDACEYARDDVCLDFTSVTDHDCHLYGYELQPKLWEETKRVMEEYNSPGEFVTVPGYEWSPTVSRTTAGHHNVYFRSCGNAQLFSSQNQKASAINGLLQLLDKEYKTGEVMVVPHHPVAAVNAAGQPEPSLTVAWNANRSHLLRLAEIYSKWGCSEGLTDFRPLRSPKKGHSVVDALKKGYRLGFTGGSDCHVAMPGSFRKEGGNNLRYPSSGMIGLWAKAKTREAVFDALYERRCYATSGQRSILEFSVNGRAMGGEVRLASPNEERHISCRVVAVHGIKEIYLLRDGKTLEVFGGGSDCETITWIDRDRLSGTAWYYVRVEEESGEMMWASPVWVHDR